MLKLFTALFLFVASNSHATLPETIAQGGFHVATAPIGSTVTVNGQKIPVADNGQFLITAARTAKGALNIVIKNGENITGKKIPITKTEWKIERINGLARKYVTPDPKVVNRIKGDNRQIGAARRLVLNTPYFQTGFIKPVPQAKRISGVFGSQRILNGTPKSPHKGIDYAAPEGTPVIAPADGKVTMVVDDMYYTGGTFIVDHGHGLSTVYAHMHTIDVAKGQEVKQGQQIGTVGKTGRATGPHLHFGATLRRVHFDPAWLF